MSLKVILTTKLHIVSVQYMKSSWEPLGPVDGMEVSGLEASDTNDGEPPEEPTVPEMVY